MISLNKSRDLVGNVYKLESKDSSLTIFDGGYRFPLEISANSNGESSNHEYIKFSVNIDDGEIFYAIKAFFIRVQIQRAVNEFDGEYLKSKTLTFGSLYGKNGCMIINKLSDDDFELVLFKNKLSELYDILFYDKTIEDEVVYNALKVLCNKLFLIKESLDFKQIAMDDIMKNNVIRTRKVGK